jgi:hypothetical protein
VGSVLEQLECHEAAALVWVEELRAEAFAVADRLDAAAGELSRLVIARRTVAELQAGMPGQNTDGGDGGVGTEPQFADRYPAGVRGSVRDEAMYDRIAGVFTATRRPSRARDVCDELGMPDAAKFTEAMRPKLKRLVADGVLAQLEPGLFTAVGAAS